MVTVANIHDGKAAYLLMRVLKELCSSVKVIFADNACRGEVIDTVRKTFGYLIKVIIGGYKEQGFRPIRKRWIVERTFAWFENDRRLCRNYELIFDSAQEIVKIAAIKLLMKKIWSCLKSVELIIFARSKFWRSGQNWCCNRW